MKHTSTKKKKKRSRPTKTPAVNGSSINTPHKQDQWREEQHEEDNEEQLKKQLNTLMEAFGSISLEEATSAYNQANGDLNKAAVEILSNLIDNDNESEDPEPSTSSISSVSSSSGPYGSGFSVSSAPSSSGSSGSGFSETDVQNLNTGRGRCRSGKQQKRVVAATGTVSTVLGKEYVRGSPRRNSAAESAARSVFLKEEKEEAEQFLCSMLGDECEISMAIVRDVLCEIFFYFL